MPHDEIGVFLQIPLRHRHVGKQPARVLPVCLTKPPALRPVTVRPHMFRFNDRFCVQNRSPAEPHLSIAFARNRHDRLPALCLGQDAPRSRKATPAGTVIGPEENCVPAPMGSRHGDSFLLARFWVQNRMPAKPLSRLRWTRKRFDQLPAIHPALGTRGKVRPPDHQL